MAMSPVSGADPGEPSTLPSELAPTPGPPASANAAAVRASVSVTTTRARPWLRWLITSHLVFGLLIVAMAAWMLQTGYNAQQQRALVAVRNLAVEMGKDVAAEFGRIDLALLNVKTRVEDLHGPLTGHGAAIETILREQMALVPELETLRFADAEGVVRHGLGNQAGQTVNLSDRDYFIAARGDVRPQLIVSEPLDGRITGRSLVALARRIDDADGRFAGIVFTGVSSEGLRKLFAGVDIGQHGAISLRSTNLRLVARQTRDTTGPAPIGSNKVSVELSDQLQRSPQAGSYIARTAIDGIERANAYTAVAPYPLIVIAGLATDDFLAPWRRQAAQTAAIVLLIWLGLAVSARVVQRAWRAEDRLAAALVTASERNSTMLLTSGDAVHVLDRGGRLVEMSASFASLLGASRERLLGRHVSSWDAALAPAVIEGWLRDLAVGDDRRFETRHRRDDGGLVDVEVVATAVSVTGDEYIYCCARDVSERRRTQRELAQAHADLQDLYDHAPCGYHQLDAAGRFLKINNTEANWLGSTPEALVGRDIRDFLDAESRERFDHNFEKFKAQGWIEDVELVLVAPDDAQYVQTGLRPRRVSASASVIYAPDGSYLASRSVLMDVTAQRRAQERIDHLAFHDELTGLPNRRLLDDRLHQALAAARRSDRPLALCYLDLDGFKNVNDRYGHAAGDALLVEVGRRLGQVLRLVDTASRVGGDEFVLVLANLDTVEAYVPVVERVLAELALPCDIGVDDLVHITASAGVAVYPLDAAEARGLMQLADAALYQAKAAGKNRVCRHAQRSEPAAGLGG